MRRINYFKSGAACKTCMLSLLVLLFVFFWEIESYPQGNAAGILQGDEVSSGFLKEYKVRAGLMAGISMPMGDLGTALGMGFGADLFADGQLPYRPGGNLLLRAGVNIGYYSFTTKNEISASLTTIPFLINCRAVYPLSYGLSPYAGLGLGLTTNMASGDVAASSYDPTVAVNFGTEYHHESIPSVDFFLDLRYMTAFETVNGQFFTVLLGAAYKFDTSAGAGAASVKKAAEPVPVVQQKSAEAKRAVERREYKKPETENFPQQENFLLH